MPPGGRYWDPGVYHWVYVTVLPMPPEDPVALAEAFQKLIDDPELRRRMGQAGREKALREFTLSRMLRETERVYMGVLDLNHRL